MNPTDRRMFKPLTAARLILAGMALLLAACGPAAPTATPSPSPPPGVTLQPPTPPVEYAVTPIPLTGPSASRRAEISGLAWHGDDLILLPQYPSFSASGEGAVYALPKAEILAYLDGDAPGPLEPVPIPLTAGGLAVRVRGFEGYEAIAFSGDQAFLTVEASPAGEMMGYLVSGRMAPDRSGLTVDPATLVKIPPQADLPNLSDEAVLVLDDRLLTFYEANGAAVNPSPVAHRFTLDLAPDGTLPLPTIEYRLTDVTAPDDEGRFWAINYFYPGDAALRPAGDPLADRYGQGPTHAQFEAVERLIELACRDAGIELVDRPPLQLALLPEGKARNWEGLVRLDDRGFLLATDEFPETILGFIDFPGAAGVAPPGAAAPAARSPAR